MENRYHLTDENPFTVITKEGEVQLGKGWLIISEEEYARFETGTPQRKYRRNIPDWAGYYRQYRRNKRARKLQGSRRSQRRLQLEEQLD